MELIFIDETGDAKFKDYLGFCVAKVNARFYARLKRDVEKALKKIEWDPDTEFKGSYLFSQSSVPRTWKWNVASRRQRRYWTSTFP